jgi:hypothetical protein
MLRLKLSTVGSELNRSIRFWYISWFRVSTVWVLFCFPCRSLDQTLTDRTRNSLTLWTFTQGTSEMEWWNPCGHPSKWLSDITHSSFSHVSHAQIWNVLKVMLSSCLNLWSQFRITGNARGKCVNLSRIHFYGQVHFEVLRKILGPKRVQVMRGWRKEQNSSLNVTIKSKVMSWMWHATCMKKNNKLFWLWLGTWKWIPSHRLEDVTKMNLNVLLNIAVNV